MQVFRTESARQQRAAMGGTRSGQGKIFDDAILSGDLLTIDLANGPGGGDGAQELTLRQLNNPECLAEFAVEHKELFLSGAARPGSAPAKTNHVVYSFLVGGPAARTSKQVLCVWDVATNKRLEEVRQSAIARLRRICCGAGAGGLAYLTDCLSRARGGGGLDFGDDGTEEEGPDCVSSPVSDDVYGQLFEEIRSTFGLEECTLLPTDGAGAGYVASVPGWTRAESALALAERGDVASWAGARGIIGGEDHHAADARTQAAREYVAALQPWTAEERKSLLEASGPVLLIQGRSGTGKTAVLEGRVLLHSFDPVVQVYG